MAEARRQREWERKLKDDGTMKPRVEGIISNFISTCGGVGAVLRYGKRKLARLIHFTGHARSDVKAVPAECQAQFEDLDAWAQSEASVQNDKEGQLDNFIGVLAVQRWVETSKVTEDQQNEWHTMENGAGRYGS